MKHASEFPGPLCSFSEKPQRAVLFFGKTTARCAFSDRRLSFIFNSALDFIMRSISIQHRFSAMWSVESSRAVESSQRWARIAVYYACRHYCCGKAVLILWVGFITNQKPWKWIRINIRRIDMKVQRTRFLAKIAKHVFYCTFESWAWWVLIPVSY